MNTLKQAISIDSRYVIGMALLVCILLLSTLESTGFTRSSIGGEEEEGSGIGGTGIRGLLQNPSDFGGSGFGGTGLKPFLGVISDEVTPLSHDFVDSIPAITAKLPPAHRSIPPVSRPLLSPVQVSRSPESALGSSASISIDHAIQRTLDIGAYSLAVIPQSDNEQIAASEGLADWQRFTRFLSEEDFSGEVAAAAEGGQREYANMSPNSPTLIEVSSDKRTLGRDARNRVQRPALPPIQRVRAIERPSILPPRIQPMRI